MPRKLSQFTGKCLILGGGWDPDSLAERANFSNPNAFFTVDIDPETKPDLVMDITDANAWKQFRTSSFDFIYFEHIPFLPNISIAVKECQRILSDRGVIFYSGGFNKSETHFKSFMEIFQSENFNYLPWKPSVFSPGLMKDFKFDKGTEGFAIKRPHELTQAFLIHNLPPDAQELVYSSLCNIESAGFASMNPPKKQKLANEEEPEYQDEPNNKLNKYDFQESSEESLNEPHYESDNYDSDESTDESSDDESLEPNPISWLELELDDFAPLDLYLEKSETKPEVLATPNDIKNGPEEISAQEPKVSSHDSVAQEKLKRKRPADESDAVFQTNIKPQLSSATQTRQTFFNTLAPNNMSPQLPKSNQLT